MKIECSFQVELPFVLNLPTQGFDVATPGGQLRLEVSNVCFALQVWNGSEPRSTSVLIGTLPDISARMGQQLTSPPAKKLRTVIRHDFTFEVVDADLPPLSADDQLQ